MMPSNLPTIKSSITIDENIDPKIDLFNDSNYKRVKLADRLPLRSPLGIDFHPTTFCNFKCLFCVHSSDNQCYNVIKNKQMSLKTFNNAVKGIKDFPEKIKAVHFCGLGEPLLNKNIYTMIESVKKVEIAEKVDIVTNGFLLLPENSKKLIQSGVDFIRISVNGLSDDDFTLYTETKVDFKKYVENIAYLYKIKQDCKIYIKILDFMVGTQEKQEFFLQTFRPFCDEISIEKYNEAYIDTKGKEELQNSNLSQRGEVLLESTVCSQPFFKMEIDPDGNILPCAMSPPPLYLGNVNQQSAYTIFHSKKANDFRFLLAHKGIKKANEVCAKCTFINLCSFNSDYIDVDTAQRLAKYYKKT